MRITRDDYTALQAALTDYKAEKRAQHIDDRQAAARRFLATIHDIFAEIERRGQATSDDTEMMELEMNPNITLQLTICHDSAECVYFAGRYARELDQKLNG